MNEEEANVVVIGGGIMGLAAACNMARLGVEKIVVLERDYLCSGASGRNGGGVRAQWSSERNIQLMKESIRICSDFATEMRINVWFRQGGYLFLARTREIADRLTQSVALQRANDLPTRLIDPHEVSSIVPELDTSDVMVASFNPDDGVVFPWPFVWGYARACQSLGVSIRTFQRVDAIEMRGSRVSGVIVGDTRIRTELVINATGAWSPEIARMVGIELPNRPHRHEICSSEPLKPFLRPLVGDLGNGLYFSQSTRGEIVGGISNRDVPPGVDQGNSLQFLKLYSKAMLKAMPRLGGVRVLRQWAGCYDITPDGSPIVGRVEEVEGFILLCGFMGHGFMMAPIMGRKIASYLVHDEERELFERWSLRRFAEGRLISENMILG